MTTPTVPTITLVSRTATMHLAHLVRRLGDGSTDTVTRVKMTLTWTEDRPITASAEYRITSRSEAAVGGFRNLTLDDLEATNPGLVAALAALLPDWPIHTAG